MSEAPARIWVWWDDAYDLGMVNTHGDKRYTPEDAREYVRADRIKELELAVRYEADLAQQALDAQKELEAKLAKTMEVVEMIASADVDAVLGEAVDLSCEIIGELMEEEEDA